MDIIARHSRSYSFGLSLAVLVPLFVLHQLSAVMAATYYVSPSGSDSTSCANAKQASSPRKTINGGLACLSSGDTLEIAGGTYDEQLESRDIPNGSDGHFTTLMGKQGEPIWIRPTSNSKGDPILQLTDGASYILIKNIGFDGKELTKFSGQNKGINIPNRRNVHNITFDQIEIKNFFGANEDALVLGESSRNIILRNSYIHDIMDADPVSGPNQAVYIRVEDGALIENNVFERVNSGMTQSHQPDVTVRNVTIRNNKFIDVYRGINVLDSAENVLIANNIMSGVTTHAIRYYGGGKNIRIFNNTIYDADIGLRTQDDGSDLLFMNNIIWKASDPIKNEGKSILSNNLTSDPQFVDAAKNDFRLMPNSPAVDAGLMTEDVVEDFDKTARPQGAAYDIGAYEMTSSSGDNSPPSPPTGLHVAK